MAAAGCVRVGREVSISEGAISRRSEGLGLFALVGRVAVDFPADRFLGGITYKNKWRHIRQKHTRAALNLRLNSDEGNYIRRTDENVRPIVIPETAV